MRKTIWLVGCLLFLIFQCKQEDKRSDRGEELALIHCSSCHQYPEPELLDQTSWQQYILPRMGYMLGVLPIDSVGEQFFETEAQSAILHNPNVFRSETSLTQEEWNQIQHFYLQQAPKILAPGKQIEIEQNLALFEPHLPDFRLTPPSTTLAQFDQQEAGFFIGDAYTRKVYRFNEQLQLQQMADVGEAPVSLQQIPAGTLLTTMGSFSPSDLPKGQSIFLPAASGSKPLLLIDSLRRPTHLALADINRDSIQDFVTCEYGKWTGGLSWWENDGRGQVKQRILRAMPGAIRTEILDINNDELPDLLALFGQGDEGIWAFYNNGDGSFKEQRLLQFPPSYGSSYFSLMDYNGDHFPDIIYTNGDNADFPPVHKPYHGIRIFENNAWDSFTEVFFYPLSGAYKAISHDFDQDGDTDLATISFFPDFVNQPEAGFLYLENLGDWNFQAFTFPEVTQGRWITMDAGDIDEDGDWEILLGALAFEVIPPTGIVDRWMKAGIPFMLLENTTNE